MFGRVTVDSVRHAVSRVRHHAVRAYQTTRHVAGQIDQAVSIAGHIYRAAQPALKHYAPEHEKRSSFVFEELLQLAEHLSYPACKSDNICQGM